jgi:hypothetical protein
MRGLRRFTTGVMRAPASEDLAEVEGVGRMQNWGGDVTGVRGACRSGQAAVELVLPHTPT